MTSHCISIEESANGIKCIVRCPKCGKASHLSSYFTLTGVGFRLSNFVRHLDETHQNETQQALPLNDIQINQLTTKLSVEKLKNKELRLKLTAKHRSMIAMQKENESVCLGTVDATNSQTLKQFDELTKTNEKLVQENLLLKEDIKKICDESKDKMTASSNLSQISDEELEKIQQLKKDLTKAKTELAQANCDRRELLHMLLEQKGKFRVVCRLRPPLTETEETTKFDIKGRKLCGNSLVLILFSSMLIWFCFSSKEKCRKHL